MKEVAAITLYSFDEHTFTLIICALAVLQCLVNLHCKPLAASDAHGERAVKTPEVDLASLFDVSVIDVFFHP